MTDAKYPNKIGKDAISDKYLDVEDFYFLIVISLVYISIIKR